ncbi:hypothetical protein BY458DRAFT_505078 [Sporodiniella umbellata]|nr:hypothetical protein BY458DRAFT_505078 [Sporodiniella umbellata]
MSFQPFVHSPTESNKRSKWGVIKTWFTPDFSKRRPSHCSTLSTASTSSGTVPYNYSVPCKQPLGGVADSLHLIDKIFFPRRTSVPFNLKEAEKNIVKKFDLAVDELDFAYDSRGSLYYSGDRVAAEEAIESYRLYYDLVISQCTLQQQQELTNSHGENLENLLKKLAELPPQEDQFYI